MKSGIFTGVTFHERTSPVRHTFRYPLSMVLLDLDELGELDRRSPLFGLNRFSPLQIREDDYLAGKGEKLRSKVERVVLSNLGLRVDGKIFLLTAPRFFGYVFNPVSFFYCFDREEKLCAFVAEVNNTFGDRHTYVVPVESGADRTVFTVPKQFHVSPFNTVEGSYTFDLKHSLSPLFVKISIEKKGSPFFYGQISGKVEEFERFDLLKLLLAAPFRGLITMPRILWQAARLHYQRRLPVYSRPIPSHANTHVVRGPTLFERGCMKAAFHMLSRIKRGTLVMRLPDGETIQFGDPTSSGREAVSIQVKHYRFFTRFLLGADVGAGEGFTSGDWDTDDLTRVLTFFVDNREFLDLRRVWWAKPVRLLNHLAHRLRRNSLSGSKKNIEDHYDLGNEMFSLFLDKTLTYSCAVFDDPDDELETAQLRKLDRILDKAGIKPGDHILEIGCGWGSLAVRAVHRFGCRVTCLTLSEKQRDVVLERLEREGISDYVTVKVQDYRKETGQYDHIVSIEMIEAVGEEFLARFFEQCGTLLKPGGRLVIQAITMPHERMSWYRRSCDWIQKHIFPGCFVPSLKLLLERASTAKQLKLVETEEIGPHYARTLREWADRFAKNRSKVLQQGFSDHFFRKWRYYFSYCEAGFKTSVLGTSQIVFEKGR